jgi:anti-sigma factor RsiW
MNELDDELGALIKSKATRHAAPPQLRASVEEMIAHEVTGITVRQPPRHIHLPEIWRRWTNTAGAFALGAVASVAIVLMVRGNADEDRIAQAVVDSHVRSLMGAHLVDVESSDRHTVKPWFSGKLDFAPTVKDLASEGIPLLGGRLDYLGQRPVAALVYRLRQHTINVFVWPATGVASTGPAFAARQGFSVAHWTGEGMQFWAVSDLNAGDLRNIVSLLASSDRP